MISINQLCSWLPKRSPTISKHDVGHVLVIAGSSGMVGAACLTALAVLRTGTGLVTVALPKSERRNLTAFLPEAMCIDVTVSGIRSFLKRRSVQAVVLGPGLGRGPRVQALIKHVLQFLPCSFVIDADGLNNLKPEELKKYSSYVMTPHEGEFARLLGYSRKKVQASRKVLAQKAATDLHGVCVLKGHHTVVSDGKQTYVNQTGSAAMATGGMGDVLAGVIGSLLAQGLLPFQAACVGVFLHGKAADLITIGDRGLLAQDVAQTIPRACQFLLRGKKSD